MTNRVLETGVNAAWHQAVGTQELCKRVSNEFTKNWTKMRSTSLSGLGDVDFTLLGMIWKSNAVKGVTLNSSYISSA